MARRLDKTLVDYVGIAISPVLIMAMVGSLVLFLLDVFYQGIYEERLQVILALFVMAIVLIGRISIEMGKEQAMLYATPLALVTALALFVLVDHGWVFNVALLGLIWWSSHKLTWDCTLIDEAEDASGEGLLQSTGLDKVVDSDRANVAEPTAEPSEDPSRPQSADDKPEKRKPHAPGVWIVYFSLAALPLFGLGELFIRNDPARKHHDFLLLLIYVASGLGLLLMTSFLGLRRYLRQRKVEMPVSMASVWIATGAVILVALLILSAVLPRPGADQHPFQLPVVLTSPERKASPMALGHDGAKGPGARGGARPQDANERQQPQADAAGSQPSSQPGGKRPSGTAAQQQSQRAGQSGNSSQQASPSQSASRQPSESQPKGSPGEPTQRPSGQQSGQQPGQARDQQSTEGSRASQSGEGNRDQRSGQQAQDQQPKGASESQSSRGGQQDRTQNQSGGQPQRDAQASSDSSRQTSREAGDRQSDQAGGKDSQEQSPSQGEASASSQASEPPKISWSMSELSLGLSSQWLFDLMRWILYLVLAVVAAIWLWRSRQEVLAAIRGMLEALRNLWASLFGGRPREEKQAEAEQEAPARPSPFASFADPFTSGASGTKSPEELVRYTFQAMEAWARERGCTRPPDQTVYEFARNVAARTPNLGQEARNLAELYNQAAYAPGTLQPEQVQSLREVWKAMQSASADGAPSVS